MATIQPTYGTRAAFSTLTNLNSLATGQAKPVGSVDNSATRADNYKIDVTIVLAAASVSATGSVTCYLLESADGGTNYTDGISPTATTDQTASIKNARAVRTWNATSNSQTIRDTFDLPVITCPKNFGLLFAQASGAALASSGHDVEYTPITYTVA